MSLTRIVVGLFLLDAISTVSCLRCFECVDLPSPFQCDIVTTCPDEYECFVDQKVTSGGMILYDVGCRSTLRCASTKRQIDMYADQEQESSLDIVTCQECCSNTSFCNKEGCGVQDPSQRGPYCYTCHIQGQEDHCRHVSRCGVGEVCSIKDTSANNISQYKTECLIPTDCQHPVSRRDAMTTTLDICPKCCNGDFCNDNCIQTVTVVNGAFSAWSTWSSCSVTCGGGHQQRSRSCTDPTPSNGGDDCVGQRAENRTCNTTNCPVDGGFSQWSNWSQCSLTCGHGGIRSRARTCDLPSPQYGGANCTGDWTSYAPCNQDLLVQCPVHGGVTQWTAWTGCSNTCGRQGQRTRVRYCTSPSPAHGGNNCIESLHELETCVTAHCIPADGYDVWSAWSACSNTCGKNVFRVRTRHCLANSMTVPQTCSGLSADMSHCTVNLCPVDGGYTKWSEWGGCSITCGSGIGIKTRYRHCSNPLPAHQGAPCSGEETNTTLCAITLPCPVPGHWSDWSQCSASCGATGHQHSTRNCHGVAGCSPSRSRPCNRWMCEADCSGHGYHYYPTIHACLAIFESDWWHESLVTCHNTNGHLVRINSYAKDEYIHHLLTTLHHSDHGAWIGLRSEGGQWHWSHNQQVLNPATMYTNFLDPTAVHPGSAVNCASLHLTSHHSPHHPGPGADHAAPDGPYGWESGSCNKDRLAVCEKTVPDHS